MKEKTTSKKQKFVRSKTFVDAETGEAIPFMEVSVEDRDFNFHKVWLQHMINALDSVSNQKLRLAFWIIDNLNRDNQLVMTQRKIAEKSGISLDTVTRTIKILQEGETPFLIKINSGAYQVNPNIVWKGSHNSRMGIIYDYSAQLSANKKTEQEEMEEEEEMLEADEASNAETA